MNNQDNIMAQARQVLQGAQGAQPQGQSVPAQALPPKPAGLPVPPPQVALQLAKMAQTMPPIVLGTLIWRALKQHGQAMSAQGISNIGGGQPVTPPATQRIPGIQ